MQISTLWTSTKRRGAALAGIIRNLWSRIGRIQPFFTSHNGHYATTGPQAPQDRPEKVVAVPFGSHPRDHGTSDLPVDAASPPSRRSFVEKGLISAIFGGLFLPDLVLGAEKIFRGGTTSEPDPLEDLQRAHDMLLANNTRPVSQVNRGQGLYYISPVPVEDIHPIMRAELQACGVEILPSVRLRA